MVFGVEDIMRPERRATVRLGTNSCVQLVLVTTPSTNESALRREAA